MVSDCDHEVAVREAAARPDTGLVTAMLRIGTSLDLDTVLQEVVEGACRIAGARYGAVATIDDNGFPRDFATSGFTEEEHRNLVEWADGPKLFAFLRDLPGPLRIPDGRAYIRSLGFSVDPLPSKAMQGMPMCHQGVHVGNFYLAEKVGGNTFTSADEEVLVLFAAHAAAAIAHAHAYRDERRARAQLEGLIETSPVGVVALDTTTGGFISLNREARRIVEKLKTPGHAPEDLLKTLTLRRADGSEISLAEIPLIEALRDAETVRAEEIELSVPDGRRVAMLIDATPIRGEEGRIASVIVTMQDLAPLRELERMRARFLGMVSHELRAPLTSIKGSAATVLRRSRNFGPEEIDQFFRIIEEQADRMDSLIGDLLDVGRIEAGNLSVAPQSLKVADLVDRSRTTFVSGGGRHRIIIDLPSNLPRVMADRERIVQVLNNLLSNAARHSPDSSPIRIKAFRDGVHVAIAVSDQGQGITPERLAQLFRPPAPPNERDGGASGGLGLSICKGLVEAHGGRIRAESRGPGQGARFTFTLPMADEAGSYPARATPRRTSTYLEADERLRILVVDDDPETLRLVGDTLDQAGYAPVVTGHHEALPELLDTERPALVLLDLMLPGIDGIELMTRVPGLADLPVLFISGYGRDDTIARALESGAEDYIVKPFSPTELLARVRAVLRRRAQPKSFALDQLTIDYQHRQVTLAGQPLELTTTEYEVLRVLSLNAGQVTTYPTLLHQVWGRRSSTNPSIVRAYVTRLRHKLGDDAKHPTYIHTHHRIGYRIPQPG